MTEEHLEDLAITRPRGRISFADMLVLGYKYDDKKALHLAERKVHDATGEHVLTDRDRRDPMILLVISPNAEVDAKVQAALGDPFRVAPRNSPRAVPYLTQQPEGLEPSAPKPQFRVKAISRPYNP
jgi:hypothetical protein